MVLTSLLGSSLLVYGTLALLHYRETMDALAWSEQNTLTLNILCGSLTLVGRRLHFRSSSSAPIVVKFTRASGMRAPSRTIAPGHGYLLTLAPGSWQACGTQAPAGRYAGYQQCLTILVAGQPKLAFGRPRVRRADVRFPVVFSPVLRGRTATLTVTPLTAHCHAKRCTTAPGTPTTKTITGEPARAA